MGSNTCTLGIYYHMQIKTFYFNPLRACTYIVAPDANDNDNGQPRPCVVVDATMYELSEEQRFAQYISDQNLRPIALLITHAHPDHICGINFLQRTYQLQHIIFPAEGRLHITELPNTNISVLHTPGHKEDSVCYLISSRHLFTGDTLFQNAVGRTDLQGGSPADLEKSIAQLLNMDENVQVFPGHGYPTTIGAEKRHHII